MSFLTLAFRMLLLFAAITSVARRAAAREEPSAAESAIAERLFEQAKEQLRTKRVSAACQSFAESQRLDPASGTLLNLAACHEQEGKLASAWVELREGVSASRRDNRPDRLRFALDLLASIEPRLAYLTLMVPVLPGGAVAVIRLDGRELGAAAWGVPIPVDEGSHEVLAQAAAGSPWRATIRIRNGEQKVVAIPAQVGVNATSVREPDVAAPDVGVRGGAATDVAATDVAATGVDVAVPGLTAQATTIGATAKPMARGSESPAVQRSPGRTTVAVVAGGLGLAAVGVGAFAGLRAATFWRERNQACHNDVCSREGLNLGDRASTSAQLATWTLAGGVAALGAGALLWLWPANEASNEVNRPVVSAHVAATPLPDGWRLQIGGVF